MLFEMACSTRTVLSIPLIALLITAVHPNQSSAGAGGQSCFCKLSENVDECACSVSSVDYFNNNQLYPLLQSLLERDFFRYYKVNMEKTCPFWTDDRSCGSEACGIAHCDDQVPSALKDGPQNIKGGTPLKSKDEPAEGCDENVSGNQIDPLDTHISQGALEQLQGMDAYDDDENQFCEIDDEQSADLHYVDLVRNPERYTGYSGNSAQRVWKSIYLENCFKPNPKFDKNFLLHPSVTGTNLQAIGGFGLGTWSRNVDFFKSRFSHELTWGEGPQRLKNVYFVFLLELRALHKIAPYLEAEMFFTGNEAEDQKTRDLVLQLRETIKHFPDHFDETALFQYNSAQARQLKEEFRVHFHNVSRIMDCVDCDKCRLWGKVQVHGIGTALKILFSDVSRIKPARDGSDSLVEENTIEQLKLTRNDLVAVLQSFGRFSSSIKEVAEFRSIM